ncbi:major facilitator superfamily domain-containing protein [Bombardia bombarda]|uniref:Major facilitator superfamily domain-containing protein n=1 Tax=Bombardia bombarda TaxID=252184 RepID=A0AA39X6L0_9PEZI|nr:major facilitator superfamily domain-containing protein [Bombardia bombarda]
MTKYTDDGDERDDSSAILPTEQTRLLISTAITSQQQQQEADDDTTFTTTDDCLERRRARLRPRVVILTFSVLFLLALGQFVTSPAINAVMESIICRDMHPEVLGAGDSASRRNALFLFTDTVCKDDKVQSRLATLRGWANTFECIPGMIGAVPYGILSDRWGRKPVLALSMVGVCLSYVFNYAVFLFSGIVPLWLMWFSAVFMFIGGGAPVLTAMLYTFLADVVPVTERATAFFQLGAVFLTAQMIAGPLAGIMMGGNHPWRPLLVGLGMLVLGSLMIPAIPETVQLRNVQESRPEEQEVNDTSSEELDDPKPATSHMANLWRKARDGLAAVQHFILSNQSVSFLMISLIFLIIGRYSSEILLQYARNRYQWDWSEAAYLMTVLGATSLFNLLVIMPAATWLCLDYFRMSASAKDILLARISMTVLVVACLLIAAATNGWLLAVGLVGLGLGSGSPGLIRSVLNTLVEKHHVGMLNTLIGLMENIGLMMAGPILAKCFGVGKSRGGAWLGLPFIAAALFNCVTLLVLCIFRLPVSQASRRRLSVGSGI